MAGSSTIEELPPQHRVLINFCGEELRNTFISHLVGALKSNNINVFIDRDEGRSEELELRLKMLEESRIALVFFSRRYTESRWCLRELARIANCVKEGKLVAIPIFYKLDPSTVQGLRGQFGEAFRDLRESDATKEIWKKALKSIAYKLGIIMDQNSDESKTLKQIVENVKILLAEIPSEGTQEASVDPSENIATGISSGGEKDKTFGISSGGDAKTNADFLNSKVKPPNTQVFINFQGDLRNNFISHLVDRLEKSDINVFIDNHEQRGEDLNILFQRIEDSGIAIVVFSSSYTGSKRCLDELVKIKERVHQGLLKVLPIYFKVTPDNVKKLKGEFGDNFRDKEYIYASDEPKIKRWKEAIVFVSHRFALTYDEKSSITQYDFVGTIVKEVLEMLQATSSGKRGQSSH